MDKNLKVEILEMREKNLLSQLEQLSKEVQNIRKYDWVGEWYYLKIFEIVNNYLVILDAYKKTIEELQKL